MSERPPALRAVLGGLLMGLANLVPGISGGTMLLAAGVYPQFIEGVAEVTTFRFRRSTIVLLACIVGAAAAAIVALAGPVGQLVVHHRWIMYSLFIGLTLGGVPVLWELIRRFDATVIVAALLGIAAMAVMAWIGPSSGGDGDGRPRYALLVVAGIAGSAAMVLPGVSGGYLLLVLGQYVAILSAIAAAKEAARAGDWAGLGATLHVIVPVGIGVVIGVAGVSNLVRLLLARFERATLGALLGLLVGAVIGLWPFQAGVAPAEGATFHGDVVARDGDRLVMQASRRVIEPADWPTAVFRPTVLQVAGAAGLVAVGFAASFAVGHLGKSRPEPKRG